jgi:hypothetical protein
LSQLSAGAERISTLLERLQTLDDEGDVRRADTAQQHDEQQQQHQQQQQQQQQYITDATDINNSAYDGAYDGAYGGVYSSDGSSSSVADSPLLDAVLQQQQLPQQHVIAVPNKAHAIRRQVRCCIKYRVQCENSVACT